MSASNSKPRISSGWLALLVVVALIGVIAVAIGAFNGSFTRGVPVTLTAKRSGLVMEPYSKVKMRGVQVGHVVTVNGGLDQISLRLEIDPDQIKYIPANVEARISATSLFGAKFVELIYPKNPSTQRLANGAVLRSENVTVEANTVFENLVELLKQIDVSKLNAVLSAIADGVNGRGERLGEAISDANEVLLALNSRSDTIRDDWRALKEVSDVYSAAADDILKTLDAAAITGKTVTDKAPQLDSLLLNVAGFSRSGVRLLGPTKDNLVATINALQSTTSLLMKYNPALTCTLVGAKKVVDDGYALGGNGKSFIMDAGLLLGDDPYRYPDNLPVNNAKGGAGGKPSCGSLPDVADNWPVRALVTDTGFGTGLDLRPNPGIGFPGIANYFPVTKAIPEPPRIRYPGSPAPGPAPYPGAPPYGAPQYGLDGSPLYPGVPPAPPPTP
ncbi:MCE family protein [Mycobacterium sp. OAS707]|uniref:MCE family protein n=1 Tax=Mycobacterium sp. OAS707 TaxID=2663822 RepID=UPI0017898417|nr:MCE family protein [Mycobacterium sp. OAS707]